MLILGFVLRHGEEEGFWTNFYINTRLPHGNVSHFHILIPMKEVCYKFMYRIPHSWTSYGMRIFRILTIIRLDTKREFDEEKSKKVSLIVWLGSAMIVNKHNLCVLYTCIRMLVSHPKNFTLFRYITNQKNSLIFLTIVKREEKWTHRSLYGELQIFFFQVFNDYHFHILIGYDFRTSHTQPNRTTLTRLKRKDVQHMKHGEEER